MIEINSVSFFGQQDYQSPQYPPIVAGWKIKNPQNVGSMMRLLDNIGGTRVVLLDDENTKREREIRKIAGLSYAHISLEYQDSQSFYEQLPEGYEVVAVETSANSTNIYQTKLPEKIVLLMGSENHGLPEEWLLKSNYTVHIPMSGSCKSMNVSHALAVGLFEWQRQHLFG